MEEGVEKVYLFHMYLILIQVSGMINTYVGIPLPLKRDRNDRIIFVSRVEEAAIRIAIAISYVNPNRIAASSTNSFLLFCHSE